MKIDPEDYLDFVEVIAKSVHKSLPPSIQIEDLISIGYFGLLDAIRRFDPKRGVKFETFANKRIRGSMLDELRKLDWVPRLVRQRKEEVIGMSNFSDILPTISDGEKREFIIKDESGENEIAVEVSLRIEEALSALKPRYKEAIVLYYLLGWNLRESAEFMGTTESRVCQIIKKALPMLKKRLEK